MFWFLMIIGIIFFWLTFHAFDIEISPPIELYFSYISGCAAANTAIMLEFFLGFEFKNKTDDYQKEYDVWLKSLSGKLGHE